MPSPEYNPRDVAFSAPTRHVVEAVVEALTAQIIAAERRAWDQADEASHAYDLEMQMRQERDEARAEAVALRANFDGECALTRAAYAERDAANARVAALEAEKAAGWQARWLPMPEGDRLESLSVLAFRSLPNGEPSCCLAKGAVYSSTVYGYIPLPPLPTAPVVEPANVFDADIYTTPAERAVAEAGGEEAGT